MRFPEEILDSAAKKDYIPAVVSIEGAFARRREMRETAGASAHGSQPRAGAAWGLRPATIGSPAGSSADGESDLSGALHEKRGPAP
jgi:hypothetical protein